MPQFETTRRIRHSPEKMFALVADIEKYPQFLPLCTGLTVRSRKERDGRKGRSLTGTHHAGFFRTPKHVDAPDPMSTPKSLVDPNANSSNRLSSVP